MPDDVTSLRIRVLSEDVDKAHRRLENLERQGKTTEGAIDRMGRTSKISFGAIAAGIGSVAAISATTGAAVRQWLDYDKAMKEVLSITNLSGEQFGVLREDVLRLSTAMGVDATVAAKGLYQALSAGVPQDNVLQFMEVASKSAIAGVTEVNVAVDGLTNVINAYHLEASDAMSVSDKLFATVVDGKTTFEELASNMSKASVIAASLDVPFEELLASIISITKQGTPTTEAFTQMKATFTALLRPTDELKIALDSMGVSSGRQAIAQYGLAGALEMVRQRFEGNDAMMVKALGSTEAYNGVLSITGTNLGTFQKGLENVNNSAGKTNKAFKDNADTLAIAFQSLKTTFVSFVESLEASFGIIQKTSSLLKQLTSDIQTVRNMGSEAITSAASMGGVVGVNLLQDEVAKLEALKAQLEVRKGQGNFTTGIGKDNGGFGDGSFMTSGALPLAGALEDVEAKLTKARQALAAFDEETVKSAELQRALADAVQDGNVQAETNIRAKIDAQNVSVDKAKEEAEILAEVGELEKLLREQKVKMADEQLKKEEESAKLRKKAAEEESRANERLKEEAKDLATTEREKLELKVKQLQTAKEQGLIEGEVADKAIAAVQKQIIEYEKLLEKKQSSARAGSSRGSRFDTTPLSEEFGGLGIPILSDMLLTEEGLIKDSYGRRRDLILDETRNTAELQAGIWVDAQEAMARQMEESLIGRQRFELNAYSEFFGNIASLSNFHSEKAFKVAQAAAIAQATIKMYESAVAAYASGSAISPFLGPVFAAAALAAGAANIANIKSQQFQAYEHGGMIPAGSVGLVGEAGPEFVRGPAVVTSARATKGLRDGKQDGQGVKVIVNNAPGYEAEVTETEDRDGKIVEIAIVRTIDRLTKEAESGGGKYHRTLSRKFNLSRNGSAR